MNLIVHNNAPLPAPWQAVVSRYIERYRRATGTSIRSSLMTVASGTPHPNYFSDPVLAGVARKACEALKHTCSGCGRNARKRRFDDGRAFLCSSCFGRLRLQVDIQELLDECEQYSPGLCFGARVTWHEHDLSPLIRAVIPSYVWRRTEVPGIGTLRFVGREDILSLHPWLTKLSSVLT